MWNSFEKINLIFSFSKMSVHFGSCVISLIFTAHFDYPDSCCFAARTSRWSVQFSLVPNKLAICLHSLLARSRHALPRPVFPPKIEGKCRIFDSPISRGVIYARKTLRSWPQHAFNAICLPFGPINHFGSQISNISLLSSTVLPSSLGAFLLPFAKDFLVWFFSAFPRTSLSSSQPRVMIHDSAICWPSQL